MALNNLINSPFPTAVTKGGTGITTGTTAYAPLCTGTTATGNFQVASTGLSTAGFVLTSTGASSLPEFKAATGPAGTVLQVVQTVYNTQTSTNSVIAADNSKPQNTEGVEIMTASITPLSASSDLYVTVLVPTSGTQGAPNYRIATVALFKDSGADALSTANQRNVANDNNSMVPTMLTWTEASASTSARTFKVRVGTDAGDVYINKGVNDLYDDTVYSSITVTEVS